MPRRWDLRPVSTLAAEVGPEMLDVPALPLKLHIEIRVRLLVPNPIFSPKLQVGKELIALSIDSNEIFRFVPSA